MNESKEWQKGEQTFTQTSDKMKRDHQLGLGQSESRSVSSATCKQYFKQTHTDTLIASVCFSLCTGCNDTVSKHSGVTLTRAREGARMLVCVSCVLVKLMSSWESVSFLLSLFYTIIKHMQKHNKKHIPPTIKYKKSIFIEKSLYVCLSALIVFKSAHVTLHV